ncbi:hypothetical protein KSP39_PZI005340 [Platanthera zijinensis]|uniref:Vitellogenin-like protein n=1 Tax=Platanthera zijinensis TaxID=2320716 RepID=A0AAP0GBQ7_9ASPA
MGEKVTEGGGGMPEDMAEAATQCSNHPFRRNPSGICAFCLQEKLRKLVSSSKSSDPFLISTNPPPSSSSSPPSFASDADPHSFSSSTSSTRRISFLSAKHHRRKMKTPAPAAAQSTAAPLHRIAATTANPSDEVVVLNRSKSFALTDASGSPHKKSFWSFFTLANSSSALISPFGNKRRSAASSAASSLPAAGNGGADLPKTGTKENEKTPHRQQEEASSTGNDDALSGSPTGSQASSSFGRKVARSRSVGCGSRSFSGDFLERISNGFGDCTLRRVESHREAKSKASSHRRGLHADEDSEEQIKERVKCGGIFVGLGISSSIYWFSGADGCSESCGHLPGTRRGSIPHGRSKGWSWALASPMSRAFWHGGVGSQSTIIAAGVAVAGSHSETLQC